MNKEIVDLMVYLFGAYGQEGSEQRLKIYCAAFKDIPPKFLKVAINRCIDNCKFLPTIAEIKSELKEIKGQATGERKLDWDEAWKEIQEKMWHDGPWRRPEWSTPEIASVVKSIGWSTLCETQNSDMPVVRAQMKVMYEMVCHRNESAKQTENILSGRNGFESLGEVVTKMLGGNSEKK